MKDIFDQFPELHQKTQNSFASPPQLTSHDVVIRLTTIPQVIRLTSIPQGLSPF